MQAACGVAAPPLNIANDKDALNTIALALHAMTGKGYDRIIDHASAAYAERRRSGAESGNPAVFIID